MKIANKFMNGSLFFPFFFNFSQPWNPPSFFPRASKPTEAVRYYKVGDCAYSFNDLIANGRATYQIKIEEIKGSNYQLSYRSGQNDADGILFEDSIVSIEQDKDLVKTSCKSSNGSEK